MRRSLRFWLGDTLHELSDVAPGATLLDWLRLDQKRIGTKEGCAEGDCGACTVVVVRLIDGRVRYASVNSCIRLLSSLDGSQILTVEDLRAGDGALHPVQQAMMDLHGSQCGFCTPGIVMSLFALSLNGTRPDVASVEDALAGNLCRCTGYRPIVDAALAACDSSGGDSFKHKIAHRLGNFCDEADIMTESPQGTVFAPRSLETFAALYAAHSDAVLIAGSTDAALRITKNLESLPKVIDLARVDALQTIEEDADRTVFGAMVDLARVHAALAHVHPHLGELMRRFGGAQIRNTGTIGGNIANGSPIGDLPPALIALGASIVLRCGEARRVLPIEDFFIDYGKQDLAKGEFIEQVIVPKLPQGALFHVSKVSKRFDEDISAVCGAFRLDCDEAGRVQGAWLAFGGMAGTPKRAARAEAALMGQMWNEDAAARAAAALARDFTPLTDMRASARYRMTVARNLLRRFAIETTQHGVATRVAGSLRNLADA